MSFLHRISKNHLVMSALYKSVSGLSLFVSIPILIFYLGEENYGIWVLIFTLFQWVLLMDFGLASVLKTKIPELQINGDVDLINAYIKSTFKWCVVISSIVFIAFFLFFSLFDLKSLLNISYSSMFVKKIFLLNILFFCLSFILNTQKSLYVAVQKGKYAEQSIAVNQIVFLISLSIPLFFFKSISSESKLYLISFINGFVSFFVNLVYTYYFFKIEKLSLFTEKKTPPEYLKEIFSLGYKYMLIQLGVLFLFASDNYILSSFMGPKDIVPYEIVSKYFQFPLMILTAGMAPLWSLFAKHFFNKDAGWLLSSFRKFNYFYMAILVGLLICVLIANPIMKIWISKNFSVSYFLLIMVSLLTALRIFSTFYSYFFNGIGNLKSYLILLTISVFLKIPLSYLFFKLNFGVSSVVMASVLCLSFWCIVQPIEAYKIVSCLNKENN